MKTWKHPAVLFVICLTAGAVAAVQWPLPLPIGFSTQIAAGSALLAAGVLLWLLGAREMRRARTPLEPGMQPVALVTGGPFRFSRNPLYVALVTTLAAIGVMVASGWILIAAAVLLLLLDRMVIPGEESVLQADFPHEFAAWCRRVRRWL